MKIKPIFLLTFTLLFFGSLNAQPIDWDAVIDRYVEKYQPEEMPAWLFPIIFRNGLGERDTIYIGHDEDEKGYLSPHDTIYGEEYVFVDSMSFQASWGECPGCDSLSVMDVNILQLTENLSSSGIGYSIEFRNGILPIRAYFNTALFRSDSLPQIYPAPAPQLQVEVWESSSIIFLGNWDDELDEWEHFCPFDFPIVLTDSTSNMDYCNFTDSFDIHRSPSFPITHADGIDFILTPWKGFEASTQKVNTDTINIYPNPAKNYITFELHDFQSGHWFLLNALGQNLLNSAFDQKQKVTIATEKLVSGIYYLLIEQKNNRFIKKVLVNHY